MAENDWAYTYGVAFERIGDDFCTLRSVSPMEVTTVRERQTLTKRTSELVSNVDTGDFRNHIVATNTRYRLSCIPCSALSSDALPGNQLCSRLKPFQGVKASFSASLSDTEDTAKAEFSPSVRWTRHCNSERPERYTLFSKHDEESSGLTLPIRQYQFRAFQNTGNSDIESRSSPCWYCFWDADQMTEPLITLIWTEETTYISKIQ